MKVRELKTCVNLDIAVLVRIYCGGRGYTLPPCNTLDEFADHLWVSYGVLISDVLWLPVLCPISSVDK